MRRIEVARARGHRVRGGDEPLRHVQRQLPLRLAIGLVEAREHRARSGRFELAGEVRLVRVLRHERAGVPGLLDHAAVREAQRPPPGVERLRGASLQELALRGHLQRDLVRAIARLGGIDRELLAVQPDHRRRLLERALDRDLAFERRLRRVQRQARGVTKRGEVSTEPQRRHRLLGDRHRRRRGALLGHLR